METSKRTLAKALCWQVMGFVSMTALGFLFTGSVQSGGLLAAASCGLGFITYFLHEKAWARVKWGRVDPVTHRHP